MKRRILSLLLVIAMLLPVFNMTVIAANEPTITSHKNGKTYAADDFYIKWNSVSGAKRYRLAVKSLNDGSYAADIWWDDKLTKTKYECDEDDIKPGHRYKIWVGACGSSHDDVISQYSIEVTAKAAVCDHDDYEDYYDYTKYEQISGDNTYHNAVHYYERVCDDCDETIKSNVKGNIEKEKHNFSGDKCKACGYKKTCSHNDYEDYYDYTKYEQISGDNNYHNAVNYYERECDDCGKTIKSDVKGEIKKEAHSFSGDTCSVCKYKKAHTHTTQDYYKTTKYEQISGDDTYHRAVHYYDTKCTDCGATTKTDIKGNTEKEKHSFSGDTCTVCKYKKAVHTHTTQDYYKTTKYEQISGDDTYHRAVHYYDTKCTDCGATTETNVKGNTEKEKHNFSGDTCTVCKYKKSHKHTTQDYYKTTKYEQISGDDTYHRAVHYYDTKCTDCGATTETNVKGNTEKEKHDFSGDTCIVCKYKKSHKHTTQDYYKTTKYEQISGDDTYHRAVHYYDSKCTDCGTTTETNVKGDTEKEKHNFSGDTCTVCKYKKAAHKHTTQDYYKTTKYEKINGDDTYHTAIPYYDTKCSECGEIVKTDVKGSTQKEKHSFSGNQCTKCSYNKVCEHKNSEDIYFDTNYTPIDGDDTYHTATHYYNKTCKKCNEIIEKNIEGSSQKEEHKFYGNTCGCGYTKKVEQTNNNVIILGVGETKGYLNGSEIRVVNSEGTPVSPRVINGRTLIPIRFVSEKLGAKVDWNGDEQKITITTNYGTTAYYWIDSIKFVVNGVEYEDLAAPTIYDRNTFVPLRMLCEKVFGMEVKYVDNGRKKAGLVVIGPAGTLESDSYYNNLYKPHTHNYVSNGNGKHSCSSCGLAFDCDKKEQCSVCGYSSYKENDANVEINQELYFKTLNQCVNSGKNPLDNEIIVSVLKDRFNNYIPLIGYVDEIISTLYTAPSLYRDLYLYSVFDYGYNLFDVNVPQNSKENSYFLWSIIEVFDENAIRLHKDWRTKDYSIFFHESGHAIDGNADLYSLFGYASVNNITLRAWIEADIRERVSKAVEKIVTDNKLDTLMGISYSRQNEIVNKILSSALFDSNYRIDGLNMTESYVAKTVCANLGEEISKIRSNINGMNDFMVSDVYGGVTNNKINGGWGHEINYCYTSGQLNGRECAEAWAEFFAAKVTNNYSVQKQNEKYFPATCVALETLAEDMLTYYKDKYK